MHLETVDAAAAAIGEGLSFRAKFSSLTHAFVDLLLREALSAKVGRGPFSESQISVVAAAALLNIRVRNEGFGFSGLFASHFRDTTLLYKTIRKRSLSLNEIVL